MKIFGRTHLDVWGFADSDPAINVFESTPGDPTRDPRNNIEFRRARLGVSGTIREHMIYKTEIDFGHPDGLAFKDMYFGWKNLPVLQRLHIGQQKRPYGLDHLNSSRFNVFIERPFVVEALNQDARRIGITSYGISKAQDWNWRVGVYEMTDSSGSGEIVGDTLQPEVAARLANTVWYDQESDGRNYAHWAVSGSIGWPDGMTAPGDNANQARFRTRPEARSQARWLDTGRIAGADELELVGLEGLVNLGPTQITGEFMNSWVERTGGMSDLHFAGGYVYVSYFLTGEHMPWDRKSGTLGRPKPFSDFTGKGGLGAWQIGARYSRADFTNRDVFGGVGDSLTLGLNWYWNSHASLQFNYIRGEISDRQVAVGPTTFTDGDYEILGLRFRVDF